KLLQLAGRDDIEVAVGASTFGPLEQRAGDFALQGEVVVDAAEHADLAASLSWRDAVTLLVEECASEPLTVAIVGSQSNVAAALDADDQFGPSVGRLAVMGGVFDRMEVYGREVEPAADYNLNVDQPASVRSLNAGIPT